MTATESLELLREKCLKRGSSGILGIGRLFRRIDDDRSKGINFEEFSKVCSEFNLGLDGEKTKEFFNLFDKDGSGSINFNELLESLRPPMSQSRKDCIAKAFQKFDKSGDGVVNGKDIKGVYNARHHPKYQNGEWTEAEVLADFLKTFDDPNNPDGTITSSEFLNYYAGVSASIDNDAYFDLMMRNAWKL